MLIGSTSDFFFEKLDLSCLVNDHLADYRLPGFLPPFLDLQVNAFSEAQNSCIISLDLYADTQQSTVELKSFLAELQPAFPQETKMLVNGFQSWSRSELMGKRDRLKPLSLPARPLAAGMGGTGAGEAELGITISIRRSAAALVGKGGRPREPPAASPVVNIRRLSPRGRAGAGAGGPGPAGCSRT